jgi:hypothetical protein
MKPWTDAEEVLSNLASCRVLSQHISSCFLYLNLLRLMLRPNQAVLCDGSDAIAEKQMLEIELEMLESQNCRLCSWLLEC